MKHSPSALQFTTNYTPDFEGKGTKHVVKSDFGELLISDICMLKRSCCPEQIAVFWLQPCPWGAAQHHVWYSCHRSRRKSVHVASEPSKMERNNNLCIFNNLKINIRQLLFLSSLWVSIYIFPFLPQAPVCSLIIPLTVESVKPSSWAPCSQSNKFTAIPKFSVLVYCCLTEGTRWP